MWGQPPPAVQRPRSIGPQGFSFAPWGLFLCRVTHPPLTGWATIFRSFGAASRMDSGGLRCVGSIAALPTAAVFFVVGALWPGDSGPPGQPGVAVPTPSRTGAATLAVFTSTVFVSAFFVSAVFVSAFFVSAVFVSAGCILAAFAAAFW